MIDKSGIDFDRQVFVQTPEPRTASPEMRLGGLIFGLVIIAALAFLGYKLLPQPVRTSESADDPALANIDQRLSMIEERLAKLEAEKKTVTIVRKEEPARVATAATVPTVQRSGNPTYRVSPAWEGSAKTPAAPDPATARRLAALQQGLGEVQKNQSASQEAWVATTDRLSEMAGEVGSQSTTILRNQDELNELVNRTDMEAIPFELLRGSNPQPIGPVSLVLKSTNAKKQSYTLCVYVQPSCIELKDRMVHEVVQFVVSRNSAPLQVIATRIVKDEILGYLEVPRNQAAQ